MAKQIKIIKCVDINGKMYDIGEIIELASDVADYLIRQGIAIEETETAQKEIETEKIQNTSIKKTKKK